MPVITVLASFITTPLQRDSVNLRRAAEVTLETRDRATSTLMIL